MDLPVKNCSQFLNLRNASIGIIGASLLTAYLYLESENEPGTASKAEGAHELVKGSANPESTRVDLFKLLVGPGRPAIGELKNYIKINDSIDFYNVLAAANEMPNKSYQLAILKALFTALPVNEALYKLDGVQKDLRPVIATAVLENYVQGCIDKGEHPLKDLEVQIVRSPYDKLYVDVLADNGFFYDCLDSFLNPPSPDESLIDAMHNEAETIDFRPEAVVIKVYILQKAVLGGEGSLLSAYRLANEIPLVPRSFIRASLDARALSESSRSEREYLLTNMSPARRSRIVDVVRAHMKTVTPLEEVALQGLISDLYQYGIE